VPLAIRPVFYVGIPTARFLRRRGSTYRAIFDATPAADKPEQADSGLEHGRIGAECARRSECTVAARFAIMPDVALAADALLVLIQYQNKGYALMKF
jgi:hypothetical protein